MMRRPYPTDLNDEEWAVVKGVGLEAELQYRIVAPGLFLTVKGLFSRRLLIWADGGYSGQPAEWVKHIS